MAMTDCLQAGTIYSDSPSSLYSFCIHGELGCCFFFSVQSGLSYLRPYQNHDSVDPLPEWHGQTRCHVSSVYVAFFIVLCRGFITLPRIIYRVLYSFTRIMFICFPSVLPPQVVLLLGGAIFNSLYIQFGLSQV